MLEVKEKLINRVERVEFYTITMSTITYNNISKISSIMTSYSFKPSADEESIYDSTKTSNEVTTLSTRGDPDEHMETDEDVKTSATSTK